MRARTHRQQHIAIKKRKFQKLRDNLAHVERRLQARLATTNSSFVESASTATGAPSAGTTRSPLAALRSELIRTPRNSSPAQHFSRSLAEFSPIPPVNAIASSPPIAAAYAPIVFFT